MKDKNRKSSSIKQYGIQLPNFYWRKMYEMLIKKTQKSIETPHLHSVNTKIKAIRKSLGTFMKED
jgi:hypothetical protein